MLRPLPTGDALEGGILAHVHLNILEPQKVRCFSYERNQRACENRIQQWKQPSRWALGSSAQTPGRRDVLLGDGLAQWGAAVGDGLLWAGYILRTSMHPLASNLTKTQGVGSVSTSQARKLRLSGATWFGTARQPESGGNSTGLWGPQIHMKRWAIMPCLEEEIGGGVHHRKSLLEPGRIERRKLKWSTFGTQTSNLAWLLMKKMLRRKREQK